MDKIEYLRGLLYIALDNNEKDSVLELSRELDVLIIEKMYESERQLNDEIAI